ncbi:hypothetical protein [uncultured Megasphaera sp.]|jgi:hypothetical protein|uniref:hypothetical protein n=1 Tax=uncultured Megasphaera sp. TaxID=165188 RepID=UPI0020612524|nr:hypothetical protein [uncultured Megasphaera sp.]DAE81202.1 MAG TPA: PQQ enzyme repeat [Caudoviricetes sp.]
MEYGLAVYNQSGQLVCRETDRAVNICGSGETGFTDGEIVNANLYRTYGFWYMPVGFTYNHDIDLIGTMLQNFDQYVTQTDSSGTKIIEIGQPVFTIEKGKIVWKFDATKPLRMSVKFIYGVY